jgi:hypothetical protein
MCVKLVIYKNYNKSYSRIQRNNISCVLRKNRTQNEIWKNIDSNIRLFANDCIKYRKVKNKSNTEKMHKDLDTLGEWAVENGMKINPGKSKVMRFTHTTVSSSGYRVTLTGAKRPGRGVDQPPPSQPAPRTERVDYTFNLPLCLNGLFLSELYIYLFSRRDLLNLFTKFPVPLIRRGAGIAWSV